MKNDPTSEEKTPQEYARRLMDHQTVAPPTPDKPPTSSVDSGSGKRFKKAKLRLFQGKLISYHIHWMVK